MSSSECQICYEKAVKYTIQCGSTVPHQVCFDCEREMRLKCKPTQHGRNITCPFCRAQEKEPGLRSRSSYESEIKLLYQELYTRRSSAARASQPERRPAVSDARSMRPPSPPYLPSEWLRTYRPPVAPAPVPVRRIPTTCKNVNICHMRSTSRKCTYPGGCTENVCRDCKMCVSHFQFAPILGAHVAPVRIEIWD
jgi:hypothetical protein